MPDRNLLRRLETAHTQGERHALAFITHTDTVVSCQNHAYPYREPERRDPWHGDVLAGRGPLIELVVKYASAQQIEAAMNARTRKIRVLATPESLKLLQRQINTRFGH